MHEHISHTYIDENMPYTIPNTYKHITLSCHHTYTYTLHQHTQSIPTHTTYKQLLAHTQHTQVYFADTTCTGSGCF